MDDAIIAVDLVEQRVRYWSSGAERIFGWTAAEAIGAIIYDLVQVDHLPAAAYSTFLDTLRRGERLVTAGERGRKDGQRIWTEWSYTLIRDAAGAEVAILGVGRAVTAAKAAADAVAKHQAEMRVEIAERARVEQELARREHLLRSIFTTMHDGVVVFDAQGKVVEANPTAERVLGLPRDLIAGATAGETRWRAVREDGTPLPPDDRPTLRALTSGSPVIGEIMGVASPDGELRWISVSAVPLRSEPNEAPYGVVATLVDITEARRAEARVRTSEATLRRVLAGSNDGFFDLDLTTGKVNRSERVSEMLGLQVGDLEPTVEALLALIHPEDLSRFRAQLGAMVNGSDPAMDIEFRARGHSQDRWRWLHARARRATSGHGPSVSGTVSDVTARHDAQERLDAELRINERLVGELRDALAQVSTLSGFIPICMHCHKMRDDKGFWDRLEKYIGSRTGAQFSHGLCPDCEARYFEREEGD